MLNNAISEGAHWGANYPVCISTAYSDNGTYLGTVGCKGNNSIVGRIINEEKTLDPSNFKLICWATSTVDTSGNPAFTPTNNNTLTLAVKYQFHFITPLMQGLFTSSPFYLWTEVREVIRGPYTGNVSDLPPQAFITGPDNYQGGVSQGADCTPP
jgi:hypothetical protein